MLADNKAIHQKSQGKFFFKFKRQSFGLGEDIC